MPPKPVPLVANMRILATTDVHMQLTGRDDRLSLTHTDRGLARLATLIDQQRQTARGTTLLFDNGDFLQGTAMADALYDAQTDITHPLGPIMSDLAYDAVGLGNHDFDFGIPYLRRFTDALPCPVLCANLECSDLPAIAPFTVLEHKVRAEDGSHHVIRIGVVSALPQQTAIWNARFLTGCATLSDPVLAIQTISKTLRCDHGADLIIALSHGGITVDCGLPNQEHFAADVARIEEVDVVIAGHQHKLFPDPSFRNLPDTDIQDSTIAGTPCVMPGFGGSHLGQIDLHLQQNDDGWIIFDHKTSLIPAENTVEAPSVIQHQDAADTLTRRHLAREVGSARINANTFFSYLKPDKTQACLAAAMIKAVQDHGIQQDIAHLPILAATSPYLAGGRAGPMSYARIPLGPVTQKHVSQIAPFRDDVCAVVVTGADLYNWLERSCMAYCLTEDGGSLTDEGIPSFNFDSIFGTQAIYDPRQTKQDDHLRALTINGQPLAREAEFLLCLPSYRAAGGGGFLPERPIRQLSTGVSLQSAIVRWLSDHDLADAQFEPPWQLERSLGLSAVYDTHPDAEAHWDDIAEFAPEPVGRTADGYLRLRVQL